MNLNAETKLLVETDRGKPAGELLRRYCTLVYALVPNSSLEGAVTARANPREAASSRSLRSSPDPATLGP